MSETRRQPAGDARPAALSVARSYSDNERAGETFDSIRAAVRELTIAVGVSLGIALGVTVVVVSRAAWMSLNL